MERNNTLQRLATFAVIMLGISLFAFVGYQGFNPECDTTVKLKDGKTITCTSVMYGENTMHIKTCEGERKTLPINDLKEITYD